MKERKLILPTWVSSQVNKILDEHDQPTGKTIPEDEMMKQNIIANIDAADQGQDPSNLRDTVFICIRQKANENDYKYKEGDYKYSIAAIPFGDEDLVIVGTHGFDKIPTIFFNSKEDIIKTFVRLLKNITFS